MARIVHILPEFGALPAEQARDPVSGLVGAALHLAAVQAAEHGHAEVWGLTRGTAIDPWRFGPAIVRPLAVWSRLRFNRFDFRYLAPVALRSLLGRVPDVAHVHSNPYLLYAARGRRRVLHIHMAAGLDAPGVARIVRRADAVVCVSEFLRRELLRWTAFDPGRTFVVPNGVDDRFRVSGSGRPAGGSGDRPVRFLFVGQVSWEKGVTELLEAYALLRSQTTANVHLRIGGSSRVWWRRPAPGDPERTPYEEEVGRRAEALGVPLLGTVPYDSMPAALAETDVVVLPSIVAEGLPTVCLEAQAAGVPVIAFAVGGVPETIRHGYGGLLVPPGDVAALGAAMRQLAEDASLRATLSANAREHARAFTWRATAERLDSIYWPAAPLPSP